MLDHVNMDLHKIVNAGQDGKEVGLTLLDPLRMARYTQVNVPLPGDEWTSSRVLSSAAYGDGTPENALTGQPIIVHRNDDGEPESISSVIMPGLRTRVLDGVTDDGVDDDHPEIGDDTVDGTIMRTSSVRIVIYDKRQSFVSMVFVDEGGCETKFRVPVKNCGTVVAGLVDAVSTIMLRLSGMVMASPKALPVSSLVIGRPLRLDVDGHGRVVAFRSIYNGEAFPVDNAVSEDDYRHRVIGHDWEFEDHDDEDTVLGKERPVSGADVGLCRFTGRPALRIQFSDYEPGRRSSAWLPLDEDTIDRLIGVVNHDGTGMRYLSDIISGIRVGVVPSAVVGMSSISSISS